MVKTRVYKMHMITSLELAKEIGVRHDNIKRHCRFKNYEPVSKKTKRTGKPGRSTEVWTFTDDTAEKIRLTATKHPKREGVVYFIKCRDRVKIGRTYELEGRVKKLTTSCPYPIKVLHTIKSNYPNSIEYKIHKMFAHLRVHGEWFKYENEIKKYIKEMKDA